jgi:hypothetical protein
VLGSRQRSAPRCSTPVVGEADQHRGRVHDRWAGDRVPAPQRPN